MSRFKLTIKCPEPTVVTYGHDDTRGFFCTVKRAGEKIAEYGSESPGYDKLEGLLRTLVSTGVLTKEGIAEAYDYLPTVHDLCNIPSDAGQLAAAVIDNLRCGDD